MSSNPISSRPRRWTKSSTRRKVHVWSPLPIHRRTLNIVSPPTNTDTWEDHCEKYNHRRHSQSRIQRRREDIVVFRPPKRITLLDPSVEDEGDRER